MAHSHTCLALEQDLFQCGNCSTTFPTICQLHSHFVGHELGGSYHYNNVLKMAFAKYDSACVSTQTDDMFNDLSLTFQPDKNENKESTPINTNYDSHYISKINTRTQKWKKSRSMNTTNEQKGESKKIPVTFEEEKSRSSREYYDASLQMVCKQSPANMSSGTVLAAQKLLKIGETDINPVMVQYNGPSNSSANEIISPSAHLPVSKSDIVSTNKISGDTELCKGTLGFKQDGTDTCDYERVYNKTSGLIYCVHNDKPEQAFFQETTAEGLTVRTSGIWFPTSFLRDKAHPGEIGTRSIAKVINHLTAVTSQTEETIQKACSGKIVCEICGKSLRKSSLKDHLNQHQGIRPYICETCGIQFYSKNALSTHKVYKHLKHNKMKQCDFCKRKFTHNSRLKEHMLDHNKDRKFVCVECGRTYFNKQVLKRHVKHIHKSNEGSKEYHNCLKCDKKFQSRSIFQEHLKAHTNTFPCNICTMRFNRRSSLKRHQRTHSGERPHQCHICGHGFIQKTPYWVHMEKHHDLTKAQLETIFQKLHVQRESAP